MNGSEFVYTAQLAAQKPLTSEPAT
jgi:hypothetical protein